VRGATNDNNVVKLPADTLPTSTESVDAAERWKGIAEPGSSVAGGLDAIARKDKSFNANHFVSGAQTAYEMIVLAYAQGDRRTLRKLLSREVCEGFEATIRERESKGRDGRKPICHYREIRHHGGGAAQSHGADYGSVRIAAHLRDPRQGRECDRRRSRKGNRCYRRLDLCPQPVFAQSQLEARGDRSRAIAATNPRCVADDVERVCSNSSELPGARARERRGTIPVAWHDNARTSPTTKASRAAPDFGGGGCVRMASPLLRAWKFSSSLRQLTGSEPAA